MIRYGIHSEQKYFKEFHNRFDIIVFNANMIAYTPSAIASFISKKMMKGGTTKKFIIDPITHAFQHNPDMLLTQKKDGSIGIKKSIEKMLNYYGSPIQEAVENGESITPEDFEDKEHNEEFCRRVISFQKDLIHDEVMKDKDSKYFKYLNIKSISPIVLIAPYFYMDQNTVDLWLNKNIEFVNIAKELYSNEKIFAQITLEKEILFNRNKIKNIINRYGNSDCDGIFIWIDDFDEKRVNLDLLKSFIYIIMELNKNGKKVYNIYGSYLSIIMTSLFRSFRLSGVCHGPGYGEYREVVPVGGGLPIAKFYYPDIHKRLRFQEAVKIFHKYGYLDSVEEYFKNVCECPQCRNILNNNTDNFIEFGMTKVISFKRKGLIINRDFPTTSTKEICLKHYLYNKDREFKEIKKIKKDYLISKFNEMYKKTNKLIGLSEVYYLKNWAKILKENE